MIKAEDLRIGDLVKTSCDRESPKGVVCTVSEIRIVKLKSPERKVGLVRLIPFSGNDNEWTELWCYNIEGIPLTPEILEKNGWFFNTRLSFAYAREDNRLEVHFYPHSEWMYVILGSETLHKIRYVHELQHILWALGLNAELKV